MEKHDKPSVTLGWVLRAGWINVYKVTNRLGLKDRGDPAGGSVLGRGAEATKRGNITGHLPHGTPGNITPRREPAGSIHPSSLCYLAWGVSSPGSVSSPVAYTISGGFDPRPGLTPGRLHTSPSHLWSCCDHYRDFFTLTCSGLYHKSGGKTFHVSQGFQPALLRTGQKQVQGVSTFLEVPIPASNVSPSAHNVHTHSTQTYTRTHLQNLLHIPCHTRTHSYYTDTVHVRTSTPANTDTPGHTYRRAHTLTHRHALPYVHSHTQNHTLTHSYGHTHTLTHRPTYHTDTFSLTHTHAVIHALTQTHTPPHLADPRDKEKDTVPQSSSLESSWEPRTWGTGPSQGTFSCRNQVTLLKGQYALKF